MLRIEDISQDARRKLLIRLWQRGVKPRDLGISRDYYYKMRRGVKPIPDRILQRMLEIAEDDDLASVPELAPYVDFTRVKAWDLDMILEMVLSWAEAHPASARVLVTTLDAELRKRGILGTVVYVSESLLREWEDYLRSRVAAGTLSKKQARDHRNYLKRLLEKTGGIVAPDLIRRVIMATASEAPKAAQKMSEAVRLFVKDVVGDRRLWEELPRFRARSNEVKAPTWEEYCKVLRAATWPPARTILLLALSGLRIETLYTITVDSVDLDMRVLAPMRDRGHKRDWFSFIPDKAAEYLSGLFLEWREVWLETGVKGQESMRNRFVPVKPRRIRQYIYQVMDDVLGYRYQLGKIRHRVTTQLSMHLPSLWVEILTGHAPKRIVQDHYLQRDVLEAMRAKYDEAMADVPCLLSGVI